MGLVERLLQTIKNRLACIKAAARNHFNLKALINSIIYQLRICHQKTINISPFETHFGRKANTPLRNITEPDPSTITYKPILKKNVWTLRQFAGTIESRRSNGTLKQGATSNWR